MNKQTSPLAQHLHRIVRGQIQSYFNDHPVLQGRARELAVSGIAKRIVGDLLVLLVRCEEGAASVKPSLAPSPGSRRVGYRAPSPAGMAQTTVPAGMPLDHYLDEFFDSDQRGAA